MKISEFFSQMHSAFPHISKKPGDISCRKPSKQHNNQNKRTLLLQTCLLFIGAFLLGTFAACSKQSTELFCSIPGNSKQSDNAKEQVFSSETFSTPETIMTAADGNWGLSFQQDGEPPVANATYEELKKYNAYYAEDTDEKILYLTFDAGFENGNTTAILNALKKHNVHATFFVVGTYIENNPDLIKRMVNEGHTVGNHTYHHPDMSQIATKDAFEKELKDVETEYRKVTGKEMVKFYRPPQGKYNENNLQMAKEMGYHTFFWSLAYVDWYENDQPTKEEAFDKLLGRIHPGAIVLLHSTSKTNAEILDELLTKWEETGYQFKDLKNLI